MPASDRAVTRIPHEPSAGATALGVGLRDDATFDSFLPAANASLLEHLSRQPEADGEPFLYLWGAPGSGRSHLLQAACHAASDRDLRALYLPLRELGTSRR